MRSDDGDDVERDDPAWVQSTTVRCPTRGDDRDGTARSLVGRLLCASQVAYSTATTTTTPVVGENAPHYFRGVRYNSGTTARRISSSVNSVFVGRNVDGIIVAFRGTSRGSPLDWLQNAALRLRPVVFASSSSSSGRGRVRTIAVPGKVHAGFHQAVSSLWEPLVEEVQRQLSTAADDDDDDDVSLYFTGHSKGGAMASLAAVRFRLDPSLPNVTSVHTFASAKPGDSAFRTAYNQLVHQTSYESHLDLVPFLPPSRDTMAAIDNEEMMDMVHGMLWSQDNVQNRGGKKKMNDYQWDYRTVGSRVFIDREAQIVPVVTRELDNARIRDFETETLLRIQRFAAAHCSGCPGSGGSCDGYFFRALASEVCGEKC